jgi:hypothetical protein
LDSKQLGLEDVLKEVVDNTLYKSLKDNYLSEVNIVVSYRVLDYIMDLAKNTSTYPQVNAMASNKLMEIARSPYLNDPYIKQRIKLFFDNQYVYKKPTVLKIPDGSPIGTDCF